MVLRIWLTTGLRDCRRKTGTRQGWTTTKQSMGQRADALADIRQIDDVLTQAVDGGAVPTIVAFAAVHNDDVHEGATGTPVSAARPASRGPGGQLKYLRALRGRQTRVPPLRPRPQRRVADRDRNHRRACRHRTAARLAIGTMSAMSPALPRRHNVWQLTEMPTIWARRPGCRPLRPPPGGAQRSGRAAR
jgi:hypothetical protein